jgi:serine/threonine-protein kinase RsbW
MSRQIESIHLIADTTTVTTALAWLESISHRESWPTALRFALTISVDEVLTNIVSYAFQHASTPDGDNLIKAVSTPYNVCITCRISASKIQIEIADNGLPYNPTHTHPPPLASSLDNAVIGGLGLRLIRHYISEISYYYRDEYNHLILSKDIGNTTDS